ncbi:MAG TPA: SurA N-terminal domain-containing protein, partial [Elusimicrobiota bacterium]|nr:SurA N-terminal domain-containing protein [Elusimicrobiota bacterium]
MKRLSLTLLSLVGLTGLAFAAKLTNRPIATVNGEAILLSEYEKNWASLLEQAKESMPADKLDDAWKKTNRDRLLDQMIADRVLLQEAKKRKLRVNQREFENGVAQVRARFLPEKAQKELQGILRRQYAALGAEANESALDFPAALKELAASNPGAVKEADANFAAELAKEGIDQKKFEERIRDQLSVMELSKEAVRARTKPPTDEDAKKLFDRIQLKLQGKPVPGLAGEDEKDLESMAKFYTQQTGERVRARHILISVPSADGAPTGWATATPEQKA